MVEIYDDRVSIVSPGGVPKGITKENFGKRSIARNPIIADLLRRTHYIEKAGTGIGRMRELMEDAGLKEPKFQYDEFFEASFLRPSYYDKNYGTYDLSKKDNKSSKLNNTQIQMINLIKDNPSITQKEMAEKIGMALPTIRKNIQILKNKDIITREGATKKGMWIIK
ncbi:MAG: ATP-binding protein [Clostridia bacterium]